MIVCDGKHYLYRHIRLDTNEVFYVGIGTKEKIGNLYKRAYNKNRNKFWKRVVAKTEYEVEILLESDDYEFIKQKEIEFITLYGRRDLNKGTLVNLTDGGDGILGHIMGKEVITKRSLTTSSKKRNNVENKVFITTDGDEIEIVAYKNCKNVKIKFLKTGQYRLTTLGEVYRGILKNNFTKNVLGIGYTGGDVKNRTAYNGWINLLQVNKETYGICEEWLNFQNFEEWYEENYIDNWIICTNLFKDENLKCSKENTYFLPVAIRRNMYKTKGVYKRKSGNYSATFNRVKLGTFKTKKEAIEKYREVKTKYFLELILKHKESIPLSLYNKLNNYKIEVYE